MYFFWAWQIILGCSTKVFPTEWRERAGPVLDFLSSSVATMVCSIVSTPQMVITDRKPYFPNAHGFMTLFFRASTGVACSLKACLFQRDGVCWLGLPLPGSASDAQGLELFFARQVEDSGTGQSPAATVWIASRGGRIRYIGRATIIIYGRLSCTCYHSNYLGTVR